MLKFKHKFRIEQIENNQAVIQIEKLFIFNAT
jgi:hypothetical protein